MPTSTRGLKRQDTVLSSNVLCGMGLQRVVGIWRADGRRMQVAAPVLMGPSAFRFASLSGLFRGLPIWYSLVLLLARPVSGGAQSAMMPSPGGHDSFCLMLETTARSNSLPVDFLARLIWQESRFRQDVVGPITRGGERAQGIAQFMPTTAAEVGLADPFDPGQALAKSGALLDMLRNEFGNLGLAAAAYNAGPQRVNNFLAGKSGLPAETRQYVLAITGHPVEDWAKPKQQGATTQPDGEKVTRPNCESLLTTLRQEMARPMVFPQRQAPSWCRYLHHPNLRVCGSVHASPTPITASRRMDQRLEGTPGRTSLR